MLRQYVQPTKLSEENIINVLNWAEISDEAERAELTVKLRELEGPIPQEFKSQFLTTYADRVANAREWYKNAIAEIKNEEKKDSEQYEIRVADAKRRLRHKLAVAKTYRNDMENYAYALLIEWKKH